MQNLHAASDDVKPRQKVARHVGFIWGIVMLVSGRGNGGWVVLSSFVGAFLWFMLIAGLAASGT